MRGDHDNAPRPYSTLNPATGKIEWVVPGEKLPARGPVTRSRLETDQEVRARLGVHSEQVGHVKPGRGTAWWRIVKGGALDSALSNNGLPPRQWVQD